DINKKMFIIDANHEGEEDNTTVDGYVPTKNKPANIYIPLSLGQYFVENVHGLISTNNKVIVKVTFKAVRLEGDSAPCLGRIIGSKSGTYGKGSRAWGLATRNVRPSAYYSNYNRSDNGGGVRPQCTYDASTGEFVGYVGMETFNNDLASRWGVNEVLTIGNAERVYQEGTFDSTSFNSSFAISNIKVDLYTTNADGNTYTLKDLIAEDIAPALYADTVDDTSNWAFQFTGGVSNHAHDPIRGNQYKWAVEGNTGMVHAENLSTCMMNNHSLTHFAATDSTREYYHCNTCNTNYADAFGGTAISDTSATKMMAVLPAAGSGSESIFTNVRLSGFTGNQWFKFTCKVKCLGDNVPVVSTLYSVYAGTNAYETTQPSDNDGDMAVWESSYDPETYTLTGYIKAWMPTNWNKGSRYPYLRYNPISGACISIVIGNGRYIGDGYTDQNMNTRFAVTEPELYKINGATTGGDAGLTDAKSKSVTGSNLIAPITDKTIDFDSSYVTVRTHPANMLSAPIGNWYRTGNNRNMIYSSTIPSGYFDVEPTVEKPRM
ncbi:MAG: hypothetical protein J5662_04875, partial [Clostridia bacterium]|nr:hypothetical protein [Clostridia bacterium]